MAAKVTQCLTIMCQTIRAPEIEHLHDVLSKKQLTSLRIFDCNIDKKEFEVKFCNILREYCSYITCLHIRSKGSRFSNALLDAIQDHAHSFVELELNLESIDGRSLEEAHAIAKIIKNNRNLFSLSLTQVHFRESEGLTVVLSAIEESTSIAQLRMTKAQIIGPDTHNLAQILRSNTFLSKLELVQCIRDEELGIISKACESNKTLTDLIIKSSYISDKGADCIVSLLARNTGIKSFELNCHSMTWRGYQSIVNSLHSNTSLRQISMSMPDPIIDIATAMFLRVLVWNSTLERVNFFERRPSHKLHVVRKVLCDNREGRRTRNVNLRKQEVSLETNFVTHAFTQEYETKLCPHVIARAAKHPSYLYRFLSEKSEWYPQEPENKRRRLCKVDP